MCVKKDLRVKFWAFVALLFCGFVITSCSSDEDPWVDPGTDEVEDMLNKMTLREKVGQIFYIRPETMDPTVTTRDYASLKMQEVTAAMLEQNKNYPIGGIILYAHNINDEAQLERFVT